VFDRELLMNFRCDLAGDCAVDNFENLTEKMRRLLARGGAARGCYTFRPVIVFFPVCQQKRARNVGHLFSFIIAVLRQENVCAYRKLPKRPVKKIEKC
jgi:hypothetical protein